MLAETKAVAEIVKANATEVYKDSAQPSVRVLGKSLAQCVSLFATPVGRTAEIFEKNIHRYLDKLEGLKEEEIVAPDTRVLVPILEKMRFTEEEKVAEYYAQILATASTKEHSGKVMVTFIEILNRLTADEIKILEYISSSANEVAIPELSEVELTQHGLTKETKVLSISNSLPVLEVRVKTEGQKGYVTFLKNFNCLQDKVELSTPDNVDSYLDNMMSLGLIDKKHGFVFAVDKIYHHLENHPSILEIKSEIELRPKQKVEFSHGRIDITDLGAKLLSLCSPKG